MIVLLNFALFFDSYMRSVKNNYIYYLKTLYHYLQGTSHPCHTQKLGKQ